MIENKVLAIIKYNRFLNSFLIHKQFHVGDMIHRLLGIQAQYHSIAFYNIFNRTTYSGKQDFWAGVQNENIIKAWGARQTLHLYTLEIWQDLIQLLWKEKVWTDKYLNKKGLSSKKEVAALYDILKKNRVMDRRELELVFGEKANILFNWSAIFLKASRLGFLYMESEENTKKYSWYKNEHLHTNDKYNLLEKVARAYFEAYGPATLKDFAHFLGVTQNFFPLDFFHAHFNFFQYNGKNYYYTDLYEQEIKFPSILLLGKFDPLLVSYEDKSWICKREENHLIWQKAGQIEAIILLHGYFAGTWRYKIQGKWITIQTFLTKNLHRQEKSLLENEFLRVVAFFDKQLKEIVYSLHERT